MSQTPPVDSDGAGNDIRKQATELFNAMLDEDRHKAGLGYNLAQLDTIAGIRQSNKAMLAREDRRLADWAKNLENWVKKEYLPTPERQTNE